MTRHSSFFKRVCCCQSSILSSFQIHSLKNVTLAWQNNWFCEIKTHYWNLKKQLELNSFAWNVRVCIISLETVFPYMLSGCFDSDEVLSDLQKLSWLSMLFRDKSGTNQLLRSLHCYHFYFNQEDQSFMSDTQSGEQTWDQNDFSYKVAAWLTYHLMIKWLTWWKLSLYVGIHIRIIWGFISFQQVAAKG